MRRDHRPMWRCVRVRQCLLVACLGVLLCAIAAQRAARAEVQPVHSVSALTVQGNRRVETETVRSYFHFGPDRRLDEAAIDAGLKALYATGLFQDIKIETKGDRLLVLVVEAPVINRIAFEGNHHVKDEQLNGEIRSKPRGPLSKPTLQADVERIVDV